MRRFLSIVALAAFTVGLSWSARAEEAGAAAWDKKCASCHGKDGKGKTKMGEKLKIEDLSSPEKQAKFTDADLEKLILEGNKEKKMPGFKGKLSEDEVKAVMQHTRSLKGK